MRVFIVAFFLFLFINSKSLSAQKKHILTSDKDMKIHFVCNKKNQMEISIFDPAFKEFSKNKTKGLSKSKTIFITFSVEYSSVLEEKEDIRLSQIIQMILKDTSLQMEKEDIGAFFGNLKRVHKQDLKNKKRIKTEYEQSLSKCNKKPTKAKRDYCLKTLTPGRYIVSDKPIVKIDISQSILSQHLHFANFNSEKLFENLSILPCAKNFVSPYKLMTPKTKPVFTLAKDLYF